MVVSSVALAQLCPSGGKAPRVTVKAELANLKFNRKLGANSLKRLMHKLERNMHLTRGQPLGITVGAASARYQTGIRYSKRQHGGYCVWLSEANVTVGFDNLTVYIDRKYAKGSCEYDAILDHEMTHVKINRGTVKAYLPRIRKAVAKAIRAKPHIRVLGTLRQARVLPLPFRLHSVQRRL